MAFKLTHATTDDRVPVEQMTNGLEGKWKNGVPKIIAYLYPLRQLFATQYGRLPLTK